jgi:hypothetical protein
LRAPPRLATVAERRNYVTRLRLAFVAVLVGLFATGCGAADVPTATSPPTKAPAQLVLAPATGKPIVTLTGLVNDGQPLVADLASLNALPSQTLTVVEPFVKQSMTFTGVGFADLLNAARATGRSITLHALDDYEVTLDVTVLQEPGVMLATQADGKPIDGASGGPVRLVFPASSESGKDSDLWVWSIDLITVE